jgi:hypothetical protein
MAKTSEPAVDLVAAQKALQTAHAKLVKEFEKLHRAKFSAAGHQMYLEKLKAHLIALEAHTAAIRAQHDALHTQRELLHEQHESKALESGPSPRKSRGSKRR